MRRRHTGYYYRSIKLTFSVLLVALMIKIDLRKSEGILEFSDNCDKD